MTTARKRTRSNGEGGVWRDKARKRWVGSVTVGYDDDGRQQRRSVTGPTKEAVLERIREMQNAVDAGLDPAPRNLTVRKFLDLWLEAVSGTVAPLTEVQYRNVVKLYIVPVLGQKRVRTLQPKDVTAMVKQLSEDGKSPNTQRLARSILRRALRWAEVEGMVSRNVAALADGVRVGRPDNAHKALTPDEARKLIDHVRGDRYEAAFVVGLALGLRRGEILGLCWDDLDLDGTPPRLTVRRNLVRLPGEGLQLSEDTKTVGSRRTIQLPAPVVDALRRHRLAQLEERLLVGPAWPEAPLGGDLVFRAPFGSPADPDNFRQHCYRVTEQAGVGRRSPHQLRHSAASLLIAQGVPMKIVSETLGHSSIRVTSDVYAHLYDEAGAVAADAMTAALWGAEG